MPTYVRFPPVPGSLVGGTYVRYPNQGSAPPPPTPPDMPAQADLNYWFKVDGDAFVPTFMLDRSPNGIPDPTVLTAGQRGRMVYADLSATALIPNAINGKQALQMGGQTRLQPSLARNSAVYAAYYSVGTPFSLVTMFKCSTLTATNGYIILPEIVGTPAIFNNFSMYALYNGGTAVLALTNDPFGTVNLQVPITTTTFDNYSTLYLTYNGLGFSAANFAMRINGVDQTVSSSALTAATGNNGVFFGTANTASIPTGYLLESALWNRALTAPELVELSAYSQDTYGLST